jgi:hypothetical protein
LVDPVVFGSSHRETGQTMIIKLIIIVVGYLAVCVIVGILAGKLLMWSGRRLS